MKINATPAGGVQLTSAHVHHIRLERNPDLILSTLIESNMTFSLKTGQQLTEGCMLLSRSSFQLPELLCEIPGMFSDWGSAAVKCKGRKREESFENKKKTKHDNSYIKGIFKES